MINLRNYKKELLTDLEVSVKDSVKIDKIKEGEKPSILSDTMFKTMFFRLNYLLSNYLDITY